MKKLLIALLLIILICSCKKNENSFFSKNTQIDSVAIYLKQHDLDTNKTTKHKLLDKAVSYIKTQKNTQKNREYLPEIIFNYYALNDLEVIKEAALLLKNKSLKANDSINLATSYRFIGGYYKFNNVLDSAYHYYVAAEKIFNKKNDLPNYNYILLNKSIVLTSINDLYSAELNLKKALSFYRKSEDYVNLYNVLVQLGLVTLNLKENKQAILYFEEALKIYDENNLIENNVTISLCLNNLAASLISLKEYDKAIDNINNVLKDVNIKKNDLSLYSYLIDNLSYSKMKLGNLKGVKEGFIESLNIRKKLNESNEIIRTYNHLSEYYSTIGDETNAIQYANLALQTAKKSKSPFNVKAALEQASKVDKTNASNYSQEYIRISDSLQIVERKNADRFARIELETDEITNEKNLAIKQKWLYLSIISVLFIIAILLYIIKNQKTTNKQIMLQNQFQKANETIYKLMLDQQELINSSKYKEKKRIAFELHDTIINKLVGVRINLAALQKNPNTETIQNSIKHINAIQSIEEDVRNIVYDLSNETIINSDYVEIIKNQLEDFNETAISITIHNDHEIDWTQINSEVKLNLLKVIKESFKNAQKHAQATTFSITFTLDEKNLCLAINNNGQGFDVVNTKFGVGLKSIHQRINSLNGSIKINSSQKEGTIMFIAIPV